MRDDIENDLIEAQRLLTRIECEVRKRAAAKALSNDAVELGAAIMRLLAEYQSAQWH